MQWKMISPLIWQEGCLRVSPSPQMCPVGGISVAFVIALHLEQCCDFHPGFSHVGNVSVMKSSMKSCPNASMISDFVAEQVSTLHEKMRSPSFSHVAFVLM